MALSPEIQSEFDDQIATFFHRAPSHAEAEKQLAVHCKELLDELPNMGDIICDYPAYAALAFYGKMQVADRRLIARLSRSGTPASVAIDTIRAQKALRIAASAKQGWDFLSAHHLDVLWSAIQLNSLASWPEDEEEEEDGEDFYDDEDEEDT